MSPGEGAIPDTTIRDRDVSGKSLVAKVAKIRVCRVCQPRFAVSDSSIRGNRESDPPPSDPPSDDPSVLSRILISDTA